MNSIENFTNEDIVIMRSVKRIMNKDCCLENSEYKKIYTLAQEYLKKNCNHNNTR